MEPFVRVHKKILRPQGLCTQVVQGSQILQLQCPTIADQISTFQIIVDEKLDKSDLAQSQRN